MDRSPMPPTVVVISLGQSDPAAEALLAALGASLALALIDFGLSYGKVLNR